MTTDIDILKSENMNLAEKIYIFLENLIHIRININISLGGIFI